MRPLCLTIVLAATLSAANAPYIGKWKLNPSKSQLSGTTFVLDKLPTGEIRFDMSGFAYNFRTDGKEYPTPDGSVAVWTAPAPDKWEGNIKVQGKIIATYKMALKGNTVDFQYTAPQPDGKTATQTGTWKRLSGGPGFMGRWQEDKVSGASATLEIAANGSDGITMSYPEQQVSCTAKFDGKPSPVTGGGSGGKTNMSFKKTGANSFEATTLIDGKPWYVEQISVSADGKTLTDTASPIAKKEITKSVYDRQ